MLLFVSTLWNLQYLERWGKNSQEVYIRKIQPLKLVEEVSYYSATLLRYLALYTNKTIMFCKNWVCKYIQTLFTATNNNWKYSFYNKQSGLYNVVLGEGDDISLQKITYICVTTMDLKWHSNIFTYVALVKSATQ